MVFWAPVPDDQQFAANYFPLTLGVLAEYGGVYFVLLRQEGFQQSPRKHFVFFVENRFGHFQKNNNIFNVAEICDSFLYLPRGVR